MTGIPPMLAADGSAEWSLLHTSLGNHSKNKSGVEECRRRPEPYADLHWWRIGTTNTSGIYLSQNGNISYIT